MGLHYSFASMLRFVSIRQMINSASVCEHEREISNNYFGRNKMTVWWSLLCLMCAFICIMEIIPPIPYTHTHTHTKTFPWKYNFARFFTSLSVPLCIRSFAFIFPFTEWDGKMAWKELKRMTHTAHPHTKYQFQNENQLVFHFSHPAATYSFGCIMCLLGKSFTG